jgi:hypothetical protein
LENVSAEFVINFIKNNDFLQSLTLESPATAEFITSLSECIHFCILKTDMIYHFKLVEELAIIVEYNNNSKPNFSFKSLPGGLESYDSEWNINLRNEPAITLKDGVSRLYILGIILHSAGTKSLNRY